MTTVVHVQAEAKLRAQKVVVEATKVPLLMFSHINCAQSVFKVVLQKSIPKKIRLLILFISNIEGLVDEFAGELTSAKRL